MWTFCLEGIYGQWHPTPVLLPGKSHGRRGLVGCSPWGHEQLDTTERLPFHFSLSCIGERNGNPLQCSCLENPRDGGAWWAAVYGVAQSQTRLKWLSSSSSSMFVYWWSSCFTIDGSISEITVFCFSLNILIILLFPFLIYPCRPSLGYSWLAGSCVDERSLKFICLLKSLPFFF